MPVEVRNTPLMQFLAEQRPPSPYYGKALELREAVSGWLNYIPNTFPHYTRHTIEHSEEIISQMSSILFIGGDYRKPVLQELSNLEAYILIAAAYLHDSGMTVSDGEKRTILESSEWREWVEASGATRINEINAFRQAKNSTLNDSTRNFLADVQLRFLIAEFVRRTHHIRGGDILKLHQSEMGRFGYDDPKLIRTIANVCVAHGLKQNELNDPERFPESSIIRDDRVNVRLMAIMLRLGDLLDMSTDRACPLLLNAASPLPAGSMAHWTQYKAITLMSVEHNEIRITAECENQEEHRFLHDWCAWLVSELDQAQRLMARSRRHAGWLPPVATIDQAGASTINIRPTEGANYIPAQWRFELDTQAVFDRLIYDALDTPWDFLRELIQNAADASRCRMFADIKKDGGEKPLYPTQVEEEIRDTYPIRVTLDTVQVPNDLSGEMEERQVITVEDEGLGMDSDIIQKYLLQVGRSYYTTRSFRETFGFVASSRFGIGFLSVFGASEDVTIETYKPTSTIDKDPKPLKLRLTGPRSYLLTEKGNRRKPGTSIRVVLRKAAEKGTVTELVKDWCRRLEFPVFINDLGDRKEIHAEKSSDFIKEVPSIREEGGKLIIRVFPMNRDGIEGNLFILAHIGTDGERWDISESIRYEAKNSPRAIEIDIPEETTFFHGIKMSGSSRRYRFTQDETFSKRIDLRGDKFNPALTRSNQRFNSNDEFPEVEARWDEIITEHLATINLKKTPVWYYKQKLSRNIGSFNFWLHEVDTFPIVSNGESKNLRLIETDSLTNTILCIPRADALSKNATFYKSIGVVLIDNWINHLEKISGNYFFGKRILEKIEITDDFILCHWTLSDIENSLPGKRLHTLDFEEKFAASAINRYYTTFGSRPVAINTSHDFGKWYVAVRDACSKELHNLGEKQIKALDSKIISFMDNTFAQSKGKHEFESLSKFLKEWNLIPNLPSELLFENISISYKSFLRANY